MKLDFEKRNMDVATIPFRFMRILGISGTRGSEVNECFLTLEKTKKNNEQSWIKEWAAIAQKIERQAEESMKSGETLAARHEYLRASAYYQVAMF